MNSPTTTKLIQTILKKRGSLADHHPRLIKEWHPEKNGSLTPYSVTCGSNRKVWWVCQRGHQYEMAVSARVRGRGCPYCSGTRVGQGNSLADQFPQIAEEWHPTKNGGLSPGQITSKIAKKAWWICENGHEWQAVVSNRTGRGSGCPSCHNIVRGIKNRRAAVRKKGSLAETHPKLAREWHRTKNDNRTPEHYTYGSNQRAWWVCKRGHEWQAIIANRGRKGYGCPKCNPQTSRLEIRVYTELKAIFPDAKWKARVQGDECDVLLPQSKTVIEIDGYPWHFGHDAETRDKRKTERLKKSGFQVFHVRHPKLSRLFPTDFFYASADSQRKILVGFLEWVGQKSSFTTKDKEEIQNYIKYGRYRNKSKYQQIVANLPSPEYEQSLESLYPQVAKDWDYGKNAPLTPRMVRAQSGFSIWWKCKNGHSWKSMLQKRTARNEGCPYCSGRRVSADYNLARLHPQLAEEWHNEKNLSLKPNSVHPGSNKVVWWKCERNHEWRQRIFDRARQKRGCPFCSNHRAGPDNNLTFLRPEIASEWHPSKNGSLEPSDVVPGSGKKVWWRCDKGHEWQTSVRTRTRSQTRCPFCASHSVT